jgi:hypothetical protein
MTGPSGVSICAGIGRNRLGSRDRSRPDSGHQDARYGGQPDERPCLGWPAERRGLGAARSAAGHGPGAAFLVDAVAARDGYALHCHQSMKEGERTGAAGDLRCRLDPIAFADWGEEVRRESYGRSGA